ncbi:nitrite reductase large subunit NirB [Conexibacter sp. DBS9H8]|uniref:nitrite reductase large subunit NirB n=1 Tax=Conexibacter sp. DBS9H8 TaxID=2937801 RepID=UPI0020107FB2|nr:nitrite reductase large subunit NirB [Conexibacter sp. DBS9H8]
MSSAHVVIIGGGIAGQAAAESVLAGCAHGAVSVTIVAAEATAPYDRVRLSELLTDSLGAGDLALRPAEWYADHDVKLRTGVAATAVNTAERTVRLSDATVLAYDALVLATGSVPLLPRLPGIDLPHVHAFRVPADCAAIGAAARPGVRAAVIGGGLLGLEAARGLVARGAAVTVVHLLNRLMERQLDAGAAEMLLPKLEALGVTVALERDTVEITPDALCFGDGSRLGADLVVVSIGIRPQVALARGAGLQVARGIVVDDWLATSAAGVWALGECAEHAGTVHGLVAPIHDQARVLGAAVNHALGGTGPRPGPYRGSLPWAKLKVAGIDLVAIGAAEGDAEAISADTGAGVYRKLVVADGRAAGAVLLGDIRGHEALLAEIGAATEVSDPLERLAAAAALTVAELPDDAQICNCNGVCKGTLLAAVQIDGCGTPREVMARTRAGTGCGSCRAAVVEIVTAAGGASVEPHFLCACARQTRESVAAAIRQERLGSVSEVAARLGTGRECGACKPALAYLVSELNDNRHREERHARFINDRVHANIQNDGSFSVVPRMYGGVTTPDELRRIADVAERYGVRMVKVTGGQRIDLLGVAKADLPKIWRELDMPSGHAYAKAVRTVKTCVGADFCRFGIGDSVGLGIELEHAWEGLHTPAKVKSGVSGCPRNCAEATVKDVGLVAVEGGWQVRVGGAAGATVREGDILATVTTRPEAIRLATAFLQLYREEADYRERTYDYVPRVGLERIQTLLMDPNRVATLLERFRIAKAAVLDPWLEREHPYHDRQFDDLDPITAEPQPGGLSTPRIELVGPPTGGTR